MIFPEKKQIWYYDENTLYLIGEGEARISPLEAQEGIYLIPANATDQPPEEGPRWEMVNDKWRFIPLPPIPLELIVEKIPEIISTIPESDLSIYRYHPTTRVYLSETKAKLSPADFWKGRKVHIFPASTTIIPPPTPKAPYGREYHYLSEDEGWGERDKPHVTEDSDLGAKARAGVYQDLQLDALMQQFSAINFDWIWQEAEEEEKALDREFAEKKAQILLGIPVAEPKEEETFIPVSKFEDTSWAFLAKYMTR